MLTKISMCDAEIPVIRKFINGKEASNRSAFPSDGILNVTVEASRKLGASAVVLRISKDGEGDRDIPLSFIKTSLGCDTYSLDINTRDICKDDDNGLFYYEFLFLRGNDTLFTNTDNNVDFSLSDHSSRRFLMLIHKKDFMTPEWFKGRTMYHIFVDRFCRGVGQVGTREDAIVDNDWENGVPQYPPRVGEEYPNNVFFGGNLWVEFMLV